MKKIGAVTGVNFKIIDADPIEINSSLKINLSDKPISLRNLFDENYAEEYVNTLGDLILKLDDKHRHELLSNTIGYYIFVCPECRSTLTRRMISCTSYLISADLLHNAVDLFELTADKNNK